MIEHI